MMYSFKQYQHFYFHSHIDNAFVEHFYSLSLCLFLFIFNCSSFVHSLLWMMKKKSKKNWYSHPCVAQISYHQHDQLLWSYFGILFYEWTKKKGYTIIWLVNKGVNIFNWIQSMANNFLFNTFYSSQFLLLYFNICLTNIDLKIVMSSQIFIYDNNHTKFWDYSLLIFFFFK